MESAISRTDFQPSLLMNLLYEKKKSAVKNNRGASGEVRTPYTERG
jgi:hypothetical protein